MKKLVKHKFTPDESLPLLCMDIETIAFPEEEIRAKLSDFDADKVPLGKATKPETISAIIEEARLTHGDDIVKMAALNPEYSTTAIIGVMCCDKIHQASIDMTPEVEMLTKLWEGLQEDADEIIMGYYIKGFDLPYLIKRSWILGVKVPRRIYDPLTPKYPFSKRIVDLHEVFQCGQYQAKTGGLNGVAKLLGIKQKSGDGGDFATMWAKDKNAALQYNADDLRITFEIARRVL